MSTRVHCRSCHHRALWERTEAGNAVVSVEQEGGVRQPSAHPDLAAWRTWRDSRAGELGPVVGRCPACDQPVFADDDALAPSPPWTFTLPEGSFVVGAESVRGPSGEPMSDDAVDAIFDKRLRARFTDQLNSRLLFASVLLVIVGMVAIVWIGAAAFVVNFYLAMSMQGDFSGPMIP